MNWMDHFFPFDLDGNTTCGCGKPAKPAMPAPVTPPMPFQAPCALDGANVPMTNVCKGCGCEKPAPSPEPAPAAPCGCAAAEAAVTCPVTTDGAHVYFDVCEGAKEIAVTNACANPAMTNRTLDVTATLQNVCPGKCSAVNLSLTEVDEDGSEYARGHRTISVPAHHAASMQDVQLEAVRFVLPESMSLQERRHFILRTDHHYLGDNA